MRPDRHDVYPSAETSVSTPEQDNIKTRRNGRMTCIDAAAPTPRFLARLRLA